MDFTRQLLDNRRALLDDIDRRMEAALRPFAHDLDSFFATLFLGRLPADWRQQWHGFVGEQATKGFTVALQSVRELEDWIEAWAKFCGLLPPEAQIVPAEPDTLRRAQSATIIELPADYPTRSTIAAARAWDELQHQLTEETYAQRTQQVLAVRRERGVQLARHLLARALAERRLSAAASGVDGFVAGLMALRAALTGDGQHIAERDGAFKELGIERSAAATATRVAAAVAVSAAEAAAVLVVAGAVVEPVLAALAARAPATAAAVGYAAEGVGAAAAVAKIRSAYQAYLAGNTEKAVNEGSEAFVLAVLAVAGPLTRLARRVRAQAGHLEGRQGLKGAEGPTAEDVKWDETHPLIEGSVDKPRSWEHTFLQKTVAEEMQGTGFYKRVGMNRPLSDFSGQVHSPDIRPDNIGLTVDGKIDMIEIKSPSQPLQELENKLEEAMSQIPLKMRGGFKIIDPQDAFK